MPPIRKGDGTPVTPKGISQIRTGDGRILFDGPAIPDADVFHPVDEGTGTTWADEIGSRDVSFNSFSWVEDSDAFGGQKAQTDGSEDEGSLSYDELGSELNSFAIAFTIETTDESAFLAIFNSPSDQSLEIATNGRNDTVSGRAMLTIRDPDNNNFSFYSDTDITDGSRYRVFYRVIDANNHDAELYVTEEGESFGNDESNLARQESPSGFQSFEDDIDVSHSSVLSENTAAEWDALAIWENDPGAEEAQDDFDRQPWS